LKGRRNAHRLKYNELWLSTGEKDNHLIDAILCPAGPGAAPPHSSAKYWNYTNQWNLLEDPDAVFPVTSVDRELDVKDENYVPKNEKDRLIGGCMNRGSMSMHRSDCRLFRGGSRMGSVLLCWRLWRRLWAASNGTVLARRRER
jgi:hypothetical protein